MDLDYSPALPEGIARDLERAAGLVGLPLAELELIGQDPLTALCFIEAVHRGPTTSFFDEVDWDRLASIRDERREAEKPRVAP